MGRPKKVLSEIGAPLLTCEAALADDCFLLPGFQRGPHAILLRVDRGLLCTALDLQQGAAPMSGFLTKYANLSVDSGEVLLLRLAGLHPDAAVFTLDGNFHVYRKTRCQKIRLVTPSGSKRLTATGGSSSTSSAISPIIPTLSGPRQDFARRVGDRLVFGRLLRQSIGAELADG